MIRRSQVGCFTRCTTRSPPRVARFISRGVFVSCRDLQARVQHSYAEPHFHHDPAINSLPHGLNLDLFGRSARFICTPFHVRQQDILRWRLSPLSPPILPTPCRWVYVTDGQIFHVEKISIEPEASVALRYASCRLQVCRLGLSRFWTAGSKATSTLRPRLMPYEQECASGLHWQLAQLPSSPGFARSWAAAAT